MKHFPHIFPQKPRRDRRRNMARSKSPSPPARASKKRSSRRSSDDDSDDSDEDELLRKKTERSEKRMKSKTTGGKLDSRAAENERSKEEGEIHLEDKGRVKTTESDAKKTTTKPLVVKNSTNGRAGGAYVPPFKLAQMMREIEDKSSPEYQRITWEALKKSINGLVNKINSSNVKNIVPELFNENLVRGKGLFARSVMKSQMASPQFSPVFAALVAVTNTKFPELGELVVKRVVLQFRRAFKRNDKSVCVAATKFLASLVNQQVRGVEIVRSLFLFTVSFPSWLVGSFLRFTYARADEFEQHSHRKANDE